MLDRAIKRGLNYILLIILIASLMFISSCGGDDEYCQEEGDSGVQPYTPGGVGTEDGIFKDECKAVSLDDNGLPKKNDLIEYSCSGDSKTQRTIECPAGCAETEQGVGYCIRCFDSENMKFNGKKIEIGEGIGTGGELPVQFYKGAVVYAKDINNNYGTRVEAIERCVTMTRVDEFICTNGVHLNDDPNWAPLYLRTIEGGADLPGMVSGTGCNDGALYPPLEEPPAELKCVKAGGQRCDPEGGNRRVQFCLTYDEAGESCLPCFKEKERDTGADCLKCESDPKECTAIAGCHKGGEYCKEKPTQTELITYGSTDSDYQISNDKTWTEVEYTLWEKYHWEQFQVCTSWMKPKCNLVIKTVPCDPYYDYAYGGGATLTWGQNQQLFGGDVDIMGGSSLCFWAAPYCPSGANGGCRYGDADSTGCSITNGDWNNEGECCDSNFYDDFTGRLYEPDGTGNAQPDPDCARIAGNNICDAMDYSYLDSDIVNGHLRYLLFLYHPAGHREDAEFLESILNELLEGGSWLDGIDDPIYKLNCNEITYLYDSTNWLPAEGSCNIVNVNDHEFIDVSSEENEETIVHYWIECAGNDQPYNDESNGGLTFTTGEETSCGDQTYYCSFEGKWVEDIDNDKQTCEGAGFTWIGISDTEGSCCGDDNLTDTFSYYQEYGDACYQGQVLHHCVSPEPPSVVVEDGILNICGETVENVCETHCNQFFCSIISGNWEPYYGEPRTHASTWPAGNITENRTECCEPTKCWDGTTCVSDQSYTPKSESYEGYRCINGEWINETEIVKYTWDFQEYGYCPETNQCLVNPYSTNTDLSSLQFIDIDYSLNNDIQCLNPEEYIADHYCESGTWTTRTKLIALQLLDTVQSSFDPNDYTLFCDNYLNTLNYYDYEILTDYGTNYAYDYIIEQLNKCEILDKPVPCVNKFCILKFKKSSTDYGVAIGASLNNQINNPNNFSILELFGKDIDYCNDIIDIYDNQFHYCHPSKDTWYNNNIMSIIYSKDMVNLNTIVFLNKFIELLKNPFSSIFNTILEIIKPSYPGGAEFDYSFISSAKDFSRIYISKKDNKAIYGIMEYVGDNEALAVEYSGFTANICTSVDNYWIKEPNKGVISCNITNNNYYVETLAPAQMDTWQYLTSRLRVS